MTTIPTNSDMEKLLAQEPYLGAEHLQSQYEEIWAVMGQEKFLGAKEVLRGIKKGESISQKLVEYARPIVDEITKNLERLSQEEIALVYSGKLPEEKNEQIRAWCKSLSRTYSPLMILLEDTA